LLGGVVSILLSRNRHNPRCALINFIIEFSNSVYSFPCLL